MRKNFITPFLIFLLPFLVGCSSKQDELIGTWKSEVRILEELDVCSVYTVDYYVFQKDNKAQDLTYLIFTRTDGDITTEATMRSSIDCSYSFNGEEIDLEHDYSTVKFECAKEDIVVKGDVDPESKIKLVDFWLKYINEEVIPRMKEAAPIEAAEDELVWTDVSITASTLSFEAGGNHYTLFRQ